MAALVRKLPPAYMVASGDKSEKKNSTVKLASRRGGAAGAHAAHAKPSSAAERASVTARMGGHAAKTESLGGNAAKTAASQRGDTAEFAEPAASGKREKPRKPRKQGFIRRITNQWFNRLVGAVSEGSLADQEEEYAAHRTTRDYVWNTIGIGLWGGVFPLLTIVVTQLAGVEDAGKFSMAFVTGLLLMFVANYGVRTYQVSDLNEEHTFSDYQINRILTCVIMVLAGVGYCMIRDYAPDMFMICMGVYTYKMIDGWADVYEGRLQQVDKLYLAGISQALRSLAALVVFSVVLFFTRSVAAASIAMAIAAFATMVLLTVPLAFFETPRSSGWSVRSVLSILKQCFPLFIALFMYNLIDNMPKFVMEGVLSYDNQLYFNAMYFPAHAILLMIGFIYKPLLVKMAAVWADRSKRRKFDIIIVSILGVTVLVTFGMMFVIGTIGIPIMGFLYGLDFEQFRELFYIMLAAGGMTAAIEFLYQVITVLRRQAAIVKLYLITFGFSLFIPVLLVNFTGLPGAIIGYLIVMSILFVLLIWEYISIRMEFAKGPSDGSGSGSMSAAPTRPLGDRARRPQAARSAVHGRKVPVEHEFSELPVIATAPEDGPMSWKALSLRVVEHPQGGYPHGEHQQGERPAHPDDRAPRPAGPSHVRAGRSNASRADAPGLGDRPSR